MRCQTSRARTGTRLSSGCISLGFFALAAWLGDFFLGSMFYLRSERRVLGEPAVIAAEFPVTVRDLLVREGTHVKAGSVAAVLTSQNVAAPGETPVGRKKAGVPFGVDRSRAKSLLLADDRPEGRVFSTSAMGHCGDIQAKDPIDCGEPLFAAAIAGAAAPISAAAA